MRKTTGLAVIAIAVLLAACGSHTGLVRDASRPGGVGIATGPSPTEQAAPGATTPAMPDPEPGESSPAPAPATTATTVGVPTTTTAPAVEPEPDPELDIPDLGDLDALMEELDGALVGITLTETEGDLP
jgi:hypothetical protein